MQTRDFFKTLKQIDDKFRMKFDTVQRNGMLYKYRPCDPDAMEDGRVEVCGIPSPYFYTTFPKEDFIDFTGQVSRGWKHTVQLMVERRALRASEAHKHFPGWNMARRKVKVDHDKDIPKEIETIGGTSKWANHKDAICSR